MRFGLHVLSYGSTWPETLDTVQLAERSGFDLVLGADHLFATGADPFAPFFEGWTMLAAWAATTSRVGVGLLVGANAFRNPGVVAKMAATVDHISGGRLVLGLGAAWYDDELRRHGLPTGSGIGERLAWLDESLDIIRGLLDGATVSHDGPAYRFEEVRHAPLPIQRHVPVLIGGEGERRTMTIVARHADLWQMWASPDSTERFEARRAVLVERCHELDRDPATIECLIGAKVVLRDDPADAERFFESLMRRHGWPEEVRDHAWLGPSDQLAERLLRYRDAGARGFIAQVIAPFDRETIERLPTEVRPLVADAVEVHR
jgi:alkanesulfonate monooxygenase SsuD/methylene tetrahydromethanopterin reductase-like flavin-dependent oxidoreductase (luciferase family)